MTSQIAIRIAETQVSAGSAVPVTVSFRDRATGTASTPSSIRYRVDCLTNKRNVINWTSVSASSSVDILIPGTSNGTIDRGLELEQRQITIEADTGLNSQAKAAHRWGVKNIRIYEPSVNFRDDLLLEPYFPITGDEESAEVDPDAINYRIITTPIRDISRYVDDNTGATDQTAEIQDAVNVAGVRGGEVQVPQGTYLSGPLTINRSGVYLIGSGSSTVWLFNPTSTDVLFDFARGASSVERGGISDCTIHSNNSTNKTAIRCSDGRSMRFKNITMTDAGWAGSGSIGIHMLGRDSCVFEDNQLRCARPMVLDVNPNDVRHTDFFKWHNNVDGSTATTGTTYEFVDGVALTNTIFDHCAFVLSKWGVKWVDTSSPNASYGVIFRSCRFEQASDATGYCIELRSSAQRLQEVVCDAVHFDVARNGILLGNSPSTVERVTLKDCQFAGGSGITNISMVFAVFTELAIINTHVTAGSTVTLTNAQAVSIEPFNTSEVAISKNARYRFAEDRGPFRLGVPLALPSYTVAALPSAATATGGGMIYVSNEAGGAVPAFSDGTNWRRVTDRTIVS